MTNEGVVALADAGYSNTFIVGKILISNRTRFDTSAEGLAYMRRNAIPQDLVQFILEHSAQPLFRPVPMPPPAPATTVLMKVRRKNLYVPVVVAPSTVAFAAAPVVTPLMAPPIAMPVAVAPMPVVASIPVAAPYSALQAAPAAFYGGSYTYAPAGYGSYAYPGYNAYPGYAAYPSYPYSTYPAYAGYPAYTTMPIAVGAHWWR